MDDDDIAYPRRIETQLQFLENNRLHVCGTWYRRIGSIGRSIMRPPVKDIEIKTELLFQPPLLHPSTLIRRSVFERYGGYRTEFAYAEDYELWTRIASEVSFGNVPEVLMRYSISRQQVSRRHNSDQVNSARRVRMRYLSHWGIPCSSAQLSTHLSLRNPCPIRSLQELNAIHEWLGVLSKQFPPQVASVFRRQWYLAGVRAACMGLKAYRRWNQSPLSTYAGPIRRIQLLTLCMVRLPYRSPAYNLLESASNG